MELTPLGVKYNFMAQRRLWGLISAIMVVGSIVMLFYPGPRLGTDFKGGTEVELAFKTPTSEDAIRKAVVAAGFSQPDVIHVRDGKDRYLIRVEEVSVINEEQQGTISSALCFGESLDATRCPEDAQPTEVKFSPGGDRITLRYRSAPDLQKVREAMATLPGGVKLRAGANDISLQNPRENKVEIQLESKGDQLMDGLRAALGPEVVPDQPLRVEWVGPKAGAQLRDAALKSILVAIVFVMIYLALRFDLRFAPGAAVALVHDAIATLGFLILLGKEINLTIVAALLMMVGYSVNDTVVIYDRVRENLGTLRGSGFIKIINISLSEVLSRTYVTAGMTMLSLLAFFYWGTGALKDFALTLIVGLVLGTYSSIYVALPLTYWLDRNVFSRLGGTTTGKGERKAARPKKEAAVV